MVCFCQLSKPGNAISRFLLPKRSFINFVPISETGTKRGPRLARGRTETSTKSWPSPAFFPPSLLPSIGAPSNATCVLAQVGVAGQSPHRLRTNGSRTQGPGRTTGFRRTGFALSSASQQLRDLRQVPELPCVLRGMMRHSCDLNLDLTSKVTVYSLPRAEILKSKPNKETRSTAGKEGFRVHPPSGQGLQRTAPHFHPMMSPQKPKWTQSI